MQEFIHQFLREDERPLIIRDPVHNYIELTPIEKDLIDTQIFQRLRFISQASTAFYTYPSNFSSRFQHSIGAAHLAGRFICAALQSSNSETIDKFEKAFLLLLREISEKTEIDSSEYITKYSWKAIVWQLTRLVVILHDIGHLPFSHLTEDGITPHYNIIFKNHDSLQHWQKYKDELAYHEFITLMLVSNNDQIAKIFTDQPDQPRKLFLELLRNSFQPEIELPPILVSICKIMSGEVDADRGDYIIRDGKYSGVEFGGYDLARMADFMRLHYRDNNFEFLPMELALSAVETFLGERYKLYKWVYYHHHVAQTDTALKHAIDSIIELITDGDKNIKKILDVTRFRFDCFIVEGTYSDDIYMWNVLREVYCYIRGIKAPDKKHLFLLHLLETCLHRRKLTPLWKTPEEYQSFSRREFEGAFRTAIFTRYEELFRSEVLGTNRPTDKEWTYFNKYIVLNLVARHYLEYSYIKTRDLERAINDEADDFLIILEPKRFVPVKIRTGVGQSEAKILTKGGQTPYLTDVSATIATLPNSWEKDIHLFAFGVPLKRREIDKNVARKRFIDGFIRWYCRQDLKFPGPEQ